MKTLVLRKKSFSSAFAQNWSAFVNCPKRMEKLGPFLIRRLKRYKKGLILDGALGIGCESLYLINNGFNIVSNEIDSKLMNQALGKAKEQNIALTTTGINWLDFGNNFQENYFDSIFILGNSICLLENYQEVKDAFKNFYAILKPGGSLIIDERNFENIYRQEKVIEETGKFQYSGEYMYCGEGFNSRPIKFQNDNITFAYFKGEEFLGEFDMLPLRNGITRKYLKGVGFKSIRTFYDLKSDVDKSCDFLTYEAIK